MSYNAQSLTVAMRRPLTSLTIIAVTLSGCVSLPANVAAELAPAAADQPNHFRPDADPDRGRIPLHRSQKTQ